MEKSELLKQLRIDRDEPPPSPRIPLLVVSALVVMALLGAGIWWAFGGTPAVPIKTAMALSQTAAQGSILDATGYVVARRQATVSAKITGKIEDVLIEEGQRVQEGQVLARLDDTDAKAQLALTQAQLDAARAQLADLRVQLAQAERDLRRQQELVGRKLTSAQSAEQARATVDSLQARLSAQSRLVAVAEQSLRVAGVNLDNTIVRAPFSGVIVTKAAQPGEIVSPVSAGGGFTRTGIGTIVDMDSLEIEVDVNESFIGRVHAGQPVEARLNAYPDWKIPAAVIAIIPTADRTKATVKVRIALQQKDPRIVPEMGVRVAFLNEDTPEARSQETQGVLVPASAIRLDGETPVVFVYRDGRVERRAVRLGEAVGESRRILLGVSEGERVVLSPPPTLKQGDRVAVEQGDEP